MKLVIAEKPSVAMSLAAVLGANEKKDGYMEGAIFWSWHSRKPTENNMPNGAMEICRFCRRNGSMKYRRIRKSSLTFSAG